LRLIKILITIGLLVAFAGSVSADTSKPESSLLPSRVGAFRRVSTNDDTHLIKPGLFGASYETADRAEFRGNNGAQLVVQILRFRQEADAYAFLSLIASGLRYPETPMEIHSGIGTAGFVSDSQSGFFKGNHFVRIWSSKPIDAATRDGLISEVSGKLDKGEADIPPLIKHLPNADEAQKTAVYLHNVSNLRDFDNEMGVLSAIDAGGNADVAIGTYGPSRLTIIEFNTPQLATDNDKRIVARIQELWKLGQPAPSAYRRVGNYSVLVFDAPDEQTAKQLIDQVKYEQVVQWLGDNPNILKEAEKRYVNTTLGVLIAVLKASGYALITCLGLGGLFGGLLFSYRRAQNKDVTAYSDAGGMLRLNLDEMTPETNPARLLPHRTERGSAG